MSNDLDTRDISGGYLALPRRIKMTYLGLLVSLVFAIGGWAAVMQVSVAEAKEDSQKAAEGVEQLGSTVGRIERYLCRDCRSKNGANSQDCSDICVIRRGRMMR